MRTEKEKQESKELEAYYKGILKEFAKHYVAMWNALESLGLTDRQIKGAIREIYDQCDVGPFEKGKKYGERKDNGN